MSGDRQAYAYSDDISLAALSEAGQAVRAIARQGQTASAPIGQRGRARALYSSVDPVGTLGEADKVAILERMERIARARDPRVTHVMASLAGEHETILIARSDGLVVADVRPLVRMSITVIVEENGRREQGYSGGGGRFDYAYFTDEILTRYAHEAVAQAVLNLAAVVGVAPLTGIPLPLVSYGGTSLIVILASVGILLNIDRSHGLELAAPVPDRGRRDRRPRPAVARDRRSAAEARRQRQLRRLA